MSERYYLNSPIADHVVLQGPEARHLAVVCRLRPGDAVCLFNGDGSEYHAEITAADKKRVDLTVLERSTPLRELPFRLEVACPLPKGDRGQFLIEKLTELGATRFTPLRTARSVVHPSEGRSEKLERYVIEASKQCGRNVLMRIGQLAAWEEFVGRPTEASRKLIAHPTGASVSTEGAACDTLLAIGPEGGFIDAEVDAAGANNWTVVSLGARVLRVETAALALVATLSLRPGP